MNLRKEKLVFLITIATGIALYLFTESDYTVFIIFACLIYGIFAFICSRVTGRKLDISLDISHCEQNPVISVKIKNRSLLPVLAGKGGAICRKSDDRRGGGYRSQFFGRLS